jgi:hypothetical protein
MRCLVAIASSLASFAFASAAYGQPGELDSSFGGDGKVTTDVTSRYDYAVGLVILGDGKLVAGGPASGGGGASRLSVTPVTAR